MTPYPEYKETDLAWLPQIPKHWGLVRAKQIFYPVDQRSTTGNEELLSVSERYGVIKRKNANVTMFMAASYEGYKLCWPDDLAVNSLWAWSYGLGFSKYHGIISTAYSVYRLKNKVVTNPRFYDYFVRGKDFHWELRVRSKGLWKSRYQLSDDSFLSTPIPVPPADEQEKIVQYLDAMTAKINKLIRAKKKQIALLQEQKQAIINQAVTKGLNPAAEMKDSGIDWLGQIPKHWKKNKIFRLFSKIGSGTTPPNGKTYLYKNGTIPWVNSGDLYTNEKFISCIAKKVNSNALKECSALKVFPALTIVIAMYGASIGNIGILQEEACCNQACCCLAQSKEELSFEFAFFLLCACKNYWLEKSNGGGQPNISQEIIKQTWVGVPPFEEQNAIVEYLDKRCHDIDIMIAQCEKEIALAAEHKNSLISSAVTGQIDLRNTEVEFVPLDDLNAEDDSNLDAEEESEPTSTEESEG